VARAATASFSVFTNDHDARGRTSAATTPSITLTSDYALTPHELQLPCQSATVCLIKSPTRQHRAIGSLVARLETLADPRRRRGKRHPFVSVLLVACSAAVAGARSFAATGQ
jgi:hypothetical protein